MFINLETATFCNTAGKIFSLHTVVDEIVSFVQSQPARVYHIIIGSDSNSSSRASFVSAISVWRQGNGGIYFWTKTTASESLTWRDRIYRETMQSITLAQELRGRLRDSLGDEIFWDDQIHIDVGEVGKTREIKDTVIGMVRGYGFEAFIKPNSFGASVIADRHT